MKLLTESQAAEILCVQPHTLAVWRCTNRYPLKYVKVGRSVRYRLNDIEDFLEARSGTHSGELETKTS